MGNWKRASQLLLFLPGRPLRKTGEAVSKAYTGQGSDRVNLPRKPLWIGLAKFNFRNFTQGSTLLKTQVRERSKKRRKDSMKFKKEYKGTITGARSAGIPRVSSGRKDKGNVLQGERKPPRWGKTVGILHMSGDSQVHRAGDGIH